MSSISKAMDRHPADMKQHHPQHDLERMLWSSTMGADSTFTDPTNFSLPQYQQFSSSSWSVPNLSSHQLTPISSTSSYFHGGQSSLLSDPMCLSWQTNSEFEAAIEMQDMCFDNSGLLSFTHGLRQEDMNMYNLDYTYLSKSFSLDPEASPSLFARFDQGSLSPSLITTEAQTVNDIVETSSIASIPASSLSSSSSDGDHAIIRPSEKTPEEMVDKATMEPSQKQSQKRRKGQKRERRPRVAFVTKSEMEHLEDGYRWRKYGQKSVKNSPFPRSYYRCTNSKCPVKKRVERCCEDTSMVITTYEGQHTHHSPEPRTGITSTDSALISHNLHGVNPNLGFSPPSSHSPLSLIPNSNCIIPSFHHISHTYAGSQHLPQLPPSSSSPPLLPSQQQQQPFQHLVNMGLLDSMLSPPVHKLC